MRLKFLRPITLSSLLCVALGNITLAEDLYDEKYRPQFHFSAKQGWLNDTNGPIYFEGQYHLFYQHNPFGTQWGNMSWGHATSPNLIHWTEQSVAIAGDPTGVKFSGTAVIDHNNTAGLQTGSTPTMALVYTSVGSFDQRMAYSNDGGVTFRYNDSNPVLPNVSGGSDRDPKVFWHEDSQKWVQVVWVEAYNGNPQSFQFYGSADLQNWSYLSEMSNYFECPDFFELPVDGDSNNSRWVLHDATGDYEVGTFDGTSFVPDNPGAGKIVLDHGANFYAAQSFENIPASDGRRIQIPWMQGASYPGMPFNQQLGFPGELTLHDTPDGIRMYREPVDEIADIHGTEHALNNIAIIPGSDPLGGLTGDLFHIKTQIDLGTASSVGFNIRGTQVNYDVGSQTLSALGRSAALAPDNGMIELELLVDRSSLELFGGGGRVSMSSGFNPSAGNLDINLYATGGNAQVVTLSAFELQSAWPSQQPTPSGGLISRWQFNDPTNMAGFAESAGQNFVLSNSGIQSSVSGVAGTAVHLDSTNDHGFVPDNSAMNADSFTVSLWLDPQNEGEHGSIVGKTSYSSQGAWGIERLSDGRLKFFIESQSGQVGEVISDQAASAGDWHHAVASYNATLGRLELYLDGVFSGASQGETSGPLDFDNAPFMVGRRKVGTSLGAMRGKLDELQLYGSALSPGEIEFLNKHPELAVDPNTYVVGGLKLEVTLTSGGISIVNTDTVAASLKGYTILSNSASLKTGGWQSLEDRVSPEFDGWEEANPSANSLSELNPLGSYELSPSARLALGDPVSAIPLPEFGTSIRNTDYAFEYITSSGQVLHGEVDFLGATINNLVVTVDPSLGETTLSNDSPYTIALLGYTISSESGSLLPADGQWESLDDQGLLGIEEANASTDNLSELVPFVGNAIVLTPGQSYSLGAAFNANGTQDLAFEFYLITEPLEGDFNADGTVDGGDLIAWEAGYGSAYSGADFLTWQRNLGSSNPGSTPLTMNGLVMYQSALAAVAVVPEPTTAALLFSPLAMFSLLSRRRRVSLAVKDLTAGSGGIH